MSAVDPRTEALNIAHAKKMAARADGTAKVQRYPANRGAGLIAEISGVDARHQAKLEARIAAFNAGRKPNKDGFLDVSEPAKGDAGKAEAAPVEKASPAPKAEAKGGPKGDAGKG